MSIRPRPSVLFLIGVLCLGAAPRLRASERPAGLADVLPPELAAEAEIVVRIDDPEWLVAKTDALIGSVGGRIAFLRTLIAEGLFHSGQLAGVDLGRPALLAYRGGDAPLMAIIPVRDRRAFLKSFGKARLLDNQMVRINELNGTIVYSQNTMQGLWEYRLLVRERYACLARTAEECQLLSQVELEVRDPAVPLAFVSRGPTILQLFAGRFGTLKRLAIEMGLFTHPLQHFMLEHWCGNIDQIESVSGRILIAEDSIALPQVFVRGRAETPLAFWIGRQHNRASRLLPVVARRDDLFNLHGSIQWQGELEDFGRHLLERLAGEVPPTAEGAEPVLDQEREAAIRSYFGLLDRRGAFACAWEMQDTAGGSPMLALRMACEQQLPHDFLRGQRALDQLFAAVGQHRVGSLGTLAGKVSYRRPVAASDVEGAEILKVAHERHLLAAFAAQPAAASVAATTMGTILAEDRSPHGAPGIAVLRLHLDAVLARLGAMHGGPDRDGGLDLDIAARMVSGQDLLIESRVPLEKVNALLRSTTFVVDQPPPEDDERR